MAKKPINKPITKAAPVKQPATNTIVKKERKPIDWFSVKYLCVILALVSLALYANTLRNGYVLDDVMVLKDNTFVKQGLKAIPELFSTPHMRGYLVIPNDLYRPLSLVMFAIEYQFFGPNPAVGHFFNILTFMGCVVMLFLFLNKFFEGKKTAIAFIGALVFAIHPIHTEVVANIKSRDELLCYFFGFWSLNLFMNYMKEGKMSRLVMGTVALFLAYISKETVITFLAIIPLLFFMYSNENKRRALFIMGGTILATAVFMVIRTVVLNKYDANQSGATIDFMDNALVGAPGIASRVATEFYVIGKYLALMFIPYPLLCNYSFNAIPFVGFGDIKALLSVAAYGFLAVFSIMRLLKNKKDPWAFAIIFYLATLSLFSNFPFLMGAEMAERFSFFASTGVCIAIALAMEQWIIKSGATDILSLKSTKVMAVLIPLFLIFGGMTIARNNTWQNEYTLYKTDLEKSPHDCRLYQYVATAISEDLYPEETDTMKQKEMSSESIAYLKQALAINPDFTEAHVELGRVYDRVHMYDSALIHDDKALKKKPLNATANNNMGSVLITLGRYKEAIPFLMRSMEINPNFSFVYLNLARSYKQLQQYDSAAFYYSEMLQFDPNYLDAQLELATVYFIQQKYDDAAMHFKVVAQLKPQDPDAANNLGAAYLNAKKYQPAVEEFKRSISLNPGYVNAYSNLGRCYYFTQQYQAAIGAFTKEFTMDNKNPHDIPYLALSYQKLGKMAEAKQYEALAKRFYSDFKLE